MATRNRTVQVVVPQLKVGDRKRFVRIYGRVGAGIGALTAGGLTLAATNPASSLRRRAAIAGGAALLGGLAGRLSYRARARDTLRRVDEFNTRQRALGTQLSRGAAPPGSAIIGFGG